MAKKDIQVKTRDELDLSLVNFRKEIMNLRFQKSMGQLEKPSRIRFVRREIARIKTIINKQESKTDA